MIKRLFHIIAVLFRRIRSLIVVENIYILRRNNSIENLQLIDEKFVIREVSIDDIKELKKYSSYRNETYFDKNMLPRIKDNRWVGLATIDSTNGEIAYLAWIVKENVKFIDEMKINLEDIQIFIKDGYCVPKYRRKNIHQRMMQERINYCIRNGANEIFIGILNANKKGIINVKSFGFELYQKNWIRNINGKKVIFRKLV